jgi:hypothetical protein
MREKEMQNEEKPEDPHAERWPQAGDKLFQNGSFAYGAPLTDDISERFYRMPKAFKRSGDLLMIKALASPADRPNVIYPAIYCYRQSVELYLKTLIEKFGSEAVKKKSHGHRLNELWASFLLVCTDEGDEANPDLSPVGTLVLELQAADPGADGFRYPAQRSGAPFDVEIAYLDIDNLWEVMGSLENFFQCVDLAWTARRADYT